MQVVAGELSALSKLFSFCVSLAGAVFARHLGVGSLLQNLFSSSSSSPAFSPLMQLTHMLALAYSICVQCCTKRLTHTHTLALTHLTYTRLSTTDSCSSHLHILALAHFSLT